MATIHRISPGRSVLEFLFDSHGNVYTETEAGLKPIVGRLVYVDSFAQGRPVTLEGHIREANGESITVAISRRSPESELELILPFHGPWRFRYPAGGYSSAPKELSTSTKLARTSPRMRSQSNTLGKRKK